MKKYKPTAHAGFNVKQAQLLGETLERIGPNAKPPQLVDAARSKSSPIHDLFEWNNSTAAEKYRVFQARNFINHLEVVIETTAGQRTTKAFHSVSIDTHKKQERGYCSLEMIVEDEGLNAQVIANALRELNYWRRKYAEYRNYPELVRVFKAISFAEKRVKKPHKAKRRFARAG